MSAPVSPPKATSGRPRRGAGRGGGGAPARAAALEALLRWEEGRESAEEIREQVFARRRLSPPDRALALALTQGVLRWRLLLDHRVDALLDRPRKSLPVPVRTALRLGLFQLHFLDRVPAHAVLDDTVRLLSGTREEGLAPLVNAVLRRAAAGPPPPLPAGDSPAERIALATSSPLWLAERLVAQRGEAEAEAALSSLNRPAPLALRVNTLRASRQALLLELGQAGLAARAGELSPDAVILPEGTNPGTLAAFREGRCTVQDEGAQLLSRLLGARPGETVLDACAAPGGKAGHLAQLMRGRGTVIAADLSPARLRLLASAMRRLGISSVRPLAADMRRPAAVLRRPPARILLDAPCSGTGSLRRHPEGKWRKDPEGIAGLARLQEEMLCGCAELLPSGGRLLYATCSLLREEDEEVVDRVLAAGVLRPLPFSPAELPPEALTGRGEMRTWPHRHDCDGFYAALLERP